MKKILTIVPVAFVAFSVQLNAQKLYPVTSGEILFSQSQASFTQAFVDQYPGARLASNNVRYTMFFHLGQYLHYDFNDHIGLYSGLGIRNVGMITDETLPQTVSTSGSEVLYQDHKIIRRQYMLGLPLALKLGSFDNHIYFFGGGEIEMAFHFKEKFWTGSFERSSSKTKNTKWFANQTPTFLPSVFAGVQFPGGVNIRFKYYLENFLNSDYKLSSNTQEGSSFSLSDLSRYQESQIWYVSVCWQFATPEIFRGKDTE